MIYNWSINVFAAKNVLYLPTKIGTVHCVSIKFFQKEKKKNVNVSI